MPTLFPPTSESWALIPSLNQRKLESQGWPVVGSKWPSRVPFIETPLKPVLSVCFWLGPESLVYPNNGGLTLWP